MIFYVGLHQPSDAQHFDHCMVSVNRLRDRKSAFAVNEWMLDSAAFTELFTYGRYRHSPAEYAAQIRRWARCGTLAAASSQDYMCEPFILGKTGLDVATHQRLTIERYDAIRTEVDGAAYVLPVLQGYLPSQYADHILRYGSRLTEGMWVGVGSVCKRNGNIRDIAAVLRTIKRERPDLRLHGFGLKTTALQSQEVRDLLYSADSMAWSFAARKSGRNANDWREAKTFAQKCTQPIQLPPAPLLEGMI